MTQQPWGPPQQGGRPPTNWSQPPAGQRVNTWPPPQGPAWGTPTFGGPRAYPQQPAPGQWPSPQPQWGPPQRPGTQQWSAQQWPTQRPPAALSGYQPMLGRNSGYYPGPQPRFEPKRSPLRTLFVAILVIGLVVVGAVVVISLFDGTDNQVTADYENEEYQPPPADTSPDDIPVPSASQRVDAMKNNPFYAQTAPNPIRCEIDDISPQGTTPAETEKYLNELTACLMRVWDGAVKASGRTLPRPTVTVYTSKIQTKCGVSLPRNAFYCSADQQLYFAQDVLSVLPAKFRNHRLALDAILGHEFGHAIQGRTAILAAAHMQSADVSTREASVYSRRLEVQADCLNGMFVRSVSKSRRISEREGKDVAEIYYNIGDDILTGNSSIWGDHGLGATRRTWAEKGLGSSNVSTCNTFTVPADAVR